MMKKITVIEDNYEVRDNLCEILELANYDVSSAINGKLGIAKIREIIPDIIICDVMMPELDGYGVLKIINKDPKINHIPFIFLTAKSEKEDQRKGMGLGATDYITKPFNDVELLEAIEIRLAKSEQLRQVSDSTDEGLQSFFSQVKAETQLDSLQVNKELRKHRVKDIIYEEGQTARALFFLVTGQVKLYKTNEIGKELITQIVNEGQFFGHHALLNDRPYEQAAAVIEASSVRLIPKDDFTSLLYSSRDFSIQFIKMISNQAVESERQIIEMAYNSVRKKVANALISFAAQTNLQDHQPIVLNQSRDDLASRAGTAKETLIRTLSDFKEEGLIRVESRQIIIPKLIDLKKLNS